MRLLTTVIGGVAFSGLAGMALAQSDGQKNTQDSGRGEYQAPRTAAGHPDLQGIWTNKTLTPLTRDRRLGESRALSPEQVAMLEGENQEMLAIESAPSDPYREAGAGAAAGDDGDTNDGYNEFWKEVGTRYQVIKGEARSSIVIDPADGQIPYRGDIRARFQRDPDGPGPYDGPEARPLGERCLLSFGNHSGPPMLPVMYNNNYQIVQNSDYVMILAEMVHDARIIRLNDEHMLEMDKWMGDSVGRWENDTLVVETAGFNPQQSFRGASENLKVTEEFTRVSETEVLYRFTMQDDTVFTQPWAGEIMFNAAPSGEKIYEYACHEGNYALPGILAGARRDEMQERQASN